MMTSMNSNSIADETTSLVTQEGDLERTRRLELQKRYSRYFTVGLLGIACIIFIIFFGKNNYYLNNEDENSQGYLDVNNNNNSNNTAAIINNKQQIKRHTKFPPGFVWGSATSSYQVEGATKEDGRGLTIWDTFCYEGGHVLNNATGDVACDHYHRFKQDVKLMKDLNLRAYRFSIAWSRIFPNGKGEINYSGITFYNHLIDALLRNNIEPWITLYHWDLPQALEDDVQGWLDTSDNHTMVTAFGNYARTCFHAFGDRVKHWITLNEPWTISVHGYNDGIKAPGRHQNGTYETYIVGHNLLLAHAEAATIYNEEFKKDQGGMIGIANSADFRYPLSSTSQEDQEAAERAMMFQFGWFIEPVMTGDYPTVMRERLGDRLPQFTSEQSEQLMNSCDFLGLNTYSSAIVSTPKEEPKWGGYWADMHVTTTNDPSWEMNAMGWPIVPDATRELLLWISQRYNYPLLFITENGTAEKERRVEIAQQDQRRRNFFEGHIRACREAVQQGVKLGGYFAWSLMDNFEWEYGYERRFGLCYVNFKTQVRTPKSSALWYGETIQTNGANIA